MNFENSPGLYRIACNLSNEVFMTNEFGGIEIIFLAYPTYITSYLSPCPMTPLDGQDLMDNELEELTKIYTIDESNFNETISKWKAPLFTTRIREIVAFTKESNEFLENNSFTRKPQSHFSFLNDYKIFARGRY